MAYQDLLKGRYSETGRIYFVTTVLADRETRIFDDLMCGRKVIAEMKRLHDSGVLESLAWVVMPDHMHWLFQLGEQITLSDVLKSFKARSAISINRHLNRKGRLWQRSYYDHALRKEEDIRDVARYIVANPLRAGLVTKIGNYPLWDAAWL